MKWKNSVTVLVLAVGVILLLAQVLRLLLPGTDLVAYVLVALLGLLATLIKGSLPRQQGE